MTFICGNKSYDLAHILTRAADEIQRRGLEKGGFGTNDGRKCAMGAVRYMVHGDVNEPLLDGLWDRIRITAFRAARPRSTRETLTDLNDAKRTRKHDVVQVLRDMARVES